MKIKRIIISLLFIGIIAFLFVQTSDLFHTSSDTGKQQAYSFYHEEEGDLDAVYIGASNVYAFWQAPLAWEKYGITVHPFSTSAMPGVANRYMIEECMKSQPQALYIVNLNNFYRTSIEVKAIHFLVDFMPFSFTKAKLIQDMSKWAGIEGFDQLEFYFPVIRFHSIWSDLTSSDFHFVPKKMKGAFKEKQFLGYAEDLTKDLVVTKERQEISKDQEQILNELLDFCDEQKVKVLFAVVPQVKEGEVFVRQMNTMQDMVEKRGYTCLNMTEEKAMQDMGLDFSKDYYNGKHTNIHGSIKFTNYLSEYLIKQYGFTDKRGKDGFESWDTAAKKYHKIIDKHLSKEELESMGGK